MLNVSSQLSMGSRLRGNDGLAVRRQNSFANFSTFSAL
jgi:hypothetical protein